MGKSDVRRISGSLALHGNGDEWQKRGGGNTRQVIGILKPMKGAVHFLQKLLAFKKDALLYMNDAGNIVELTQAGRTLVQEGIKPRNIPVGGKVDGTRHNEAKADGKWSDGWETKMFSLDNRTAKTCESIQVILQENGYTVEEFLRLLQPEGKRGKDEIRQVNAVREQIGIPPKDTMMAKVIPQRELYSYLYDENYNGIRGFTAVREHAEKLRTLADYYEGARLDYCHTAFKVTNGIDGVSQLDGMPDRYYGVIEYRLEEPGQLTIPKSDAYPGSYPYTGTGFTASKEIVLPEYYQEPRRFLNGDVLYIKDSKTGEAAFKFLYDEEVESWVKMN